MEIKIPKFEKKEIEIRESYVDADGHYQERTKTILVPTGRLIEDDNSNDEQSVNKAEK